MLTGVPLRPQTPPRLGPGSDIADIIKYLGALDQSINTFITRVVTNAQGMLGVHGLSSSGVISQNFTYGSLGIGNQTSIWWSFANIEPDASYMILYSPNVSTGMVMTKQTRTTTGIQFTFSPAVPSGHLLDLCLLR